MKFLGPLSTSTESFYEVFILNLLSVISDEDMRLILLILWLAGFSRALVVENVYFNKVNEFSMSNSRWLLTFVISIDHYKDILAKLSVCINKAANISESVLSIHTPEKVKPTVDPRSHDIYGSMHTNISETYKKRYHTSIYGFYEVFLGLRSEVNRTKRIHRDLVNTFAEYKMLQRPLNSAPKRPRRRRAPLGFLSGIITGLFGLLDEASIDTVKRNVQKLFKKQKQIQHTLSESISVINASSFSIKENRQTLNEIIYSLKTLKEELVKTKGEPTRST